MLRTAIVSDIPQMQIVRHAVKENTLSDPALVTDQDCEKYITQRGKGWVYEIDNTVIAFAIADLEENSIWALFVEPHFEGQGIGRKLHDTMLQWYFEQTTHTVWLSTSPNTRAEQFYRKAGWTEVKKYGESALLFEMTHDEFLSL